MDTTQDITKYLGKDWSVFWDEFLSKSDYDPKRSWEIGCLLYHNGLAQCLDCRKIVKISDILYVNVGRCKTCEENKTECDCKELVNHFDGCADAGDSYSENDKHKTLRSWKSDRPVKKEAAPKNGRDRCCHLCGDVVIW